MFATLIIVLVFLPLFSLGGFEGRMFAPLAFAYIISITASLVVALTVTPVLCYYLLGHSKLLTTREIRGWSPGSNGDYASMLNWTLRHPYKIIGASAAMLVVAVLLFPLMGREFLPPFNEGALNINASLPPGTSLQESNRIGKIIESVLHQTPEVVSTTRRTGRAELDEHAAGVNTSEIEVVTKEGDRPHAEMMEEVRQKLARIPGVDAEVGQPISHRIDHLLSGTRAQIAIKLFGPDLATLRNKAEEIRDAMARCPGHRRSAGRAAGRRAAGADQHESAGGRRSRATRRRPGRNRGHGFQRSRGVAGAGRAANLRRAGAVRRFSAAVGRNDQRHADRYADGRESADRAGGRSARGSGAEHDQSRKRAAPHHHSGERRRPRPGQRHRRRADGNRSEGAAAARILRPVRRPV